MKIKYIFLMLSPLFLTACVGNVSHSWCPPVKLVKETPPVVYEKETLQLSADALFQFDRSGVNDLLPEGKLELDDIIVKLKSNYITIKQIDITGHTDRLGAEKYNLKLGMERAETVRNYLINNGVKAIFNVSSKGKSQPVTTSCAENKGLEALKACLQPDRRVSLEIIGIKVIPSE